MAVTLADLHALTEELDAGMAALLPGYLDYDQISRSIDDSLYQNAWRDIGRTTDWKSQLERVI